MGIFFKTDEEYLYETEVMDLLKMSQSTVRLKVRAKEMPLPTRLKSKNLWKRSDIESYIKTSKKEQ